MANIMIVDDSLIIRHSLRDMLESLGHRVVVEAEDGREAVKIYQEYEIDLVTMDIQLPGIDGIEAVRLIRELDSEAAIVMISSVEQRNRVYEAIKLGAKHYIIKPFTEHKINEVVNAVLGARPNLQQSNAVNVTTVDPTIVDHTEKQQIKIQAKSARGPVSYELKTPMMSDMPFELVMKDGRAVLTIQRHINSLNIHYLHVCLQGLLYFRKVKYVVELWEPIQYDDGFRLLINFISAVRDRKGTIGIITADSGCFIQLKAKLGHGVYHSYAEIGW